MHKASLASSTGWPVMGPMWIQSLTVVPAMGVPRWGTSGDSMSRTAKRSKR